MIAMVTGSTGLLGNNLVRELVSQGHTVKALARSADKAKAQFCDLNEDRIEIVTGDLENVDGFASHLDGCDALYNTAAYFREYYQPGNHWEKLERINITQTLALFAEAEKRGVETIVHTSSAGNVGKTSDGTPADETTPPNEDTMKNLYFRSKVLGDRAIADFLKQKSRSVSIVTVMPSWMFGPGDAAPTAAGQFVLDFLNRKLPGVLSGGVNMVDARDVAKGMILGAERGVSGETHLLGGEFVSMANLSASLETVSGVPAPKLNIPYAVALMIGFGMEAYAKITHKPILISREGVKAVCRGEPISSEKAKAQIGASFRPFRATLSDVVGWYRQNRTEWVTKANGVTV